MSRSEIPKLLWTGALMDPSGYGEATRGYIKAMHGFAGLHLMLKSRTFWRGDMPNLQRYVPVFNELARSPFSTDDEHVWVQHLTPDNWRIAPKGCIYHVGMTTFETDGVPDVWQPHMRMMDELWTFSEFNKRVFLASGIKRPIRVIPHGVDTERFSPDAPPLESINSLRDRLGVQFVFGANFEWSARKNPEALLIAYWRHFSRDDKVCLVLKTFNQYPIEKSRETCLRGVETVRARLGLKREECPPVVMMTNIMDDDDLPGFYNSLDAYVLPACGEGWGLTYSEAMSTGIPTVAVNWSAHTEFMNANNSILVDDFELKPIQAKNSQAGPLYQGHKWAMVDPDAFGLAMRRVFDNRSHPDMAAIGQRARQTMLERFTWQHAAAHAIHRLEEIWGT